jgi:hypothetical protein
MSLLVRMKKRNLLPPINLAITSIGLGTLISFLGQFTIHSVTNVNLSIAWVMISSGVIGAILGRILKLPNWWVPINFVFPIATYLCLSSSIPAWVYPSCFSILILIYWNAAGERVPLYLSNSTTWRAIGDLTSQQSGAFLDLGCGLGGIIFYLSKRYPEKRCIGIESAPLPFIIAKVRQLISSQTNIEIRYGNFWHQDFSTYGSIYAFLSPAPMEQLLEKISNEMPRGGLFISNSFATFKTRPSQIVTLEDGRQTELYIWYI